jgi:colanic acid biosynthesis glycosyl transferase WcaI
MQQFAPEVTAARVRVEAFAEGLAKRGHDVEVVCALPNHPERVVRPELKGSAVVRRAMNGFKVRDGWVRASPRKDAFSRVLLYASYAAMATAVGSALRRLTSCSPPRRLCRSAPRLPS